MDLSALTTEDLQAIQKGDMSSVSTAGLKMLTAQQSPRSKSFDMVDGVPVPSGSPAALAAQSPISGMSTLQRFGAGYGKAAYDLARGAGQLVGAVSRKDVANSNALDAPLMGTTAGKVGNIAGSVADLLPTAFLPGANTLLGAASIGAGSGLLQPSTSTGETAANVGLGAVASPLAILAGRTVGAAGKGLKAALWDPFTAPGQTRIAAQALRNFAGDDKSVSSAIAALQSAPATLPGVQPTTAELAGNAGLAQLQKTLSSNPAMLSRFTERAQSNRSAMTGAITNMAGTDAQRAQAQGMRSALTSPLYADARNVTVPADAELGQLLGRPSMSKAWERAQTLAAENGDTLARPNANDIDGKTLQYLKMGLNDLANTGAQTGMGAHEVRAIKSTLGAFNDWTTKNVPLLRAADRSYAELSGPLNQMDVSQALSDKLTPALSDFGNNSRLNAASYASAVRNGDALAADVTGQKNATLSGVLGPAHMRTVQQVGQQLARVANAAELGAPKGSPTAQNLISQNVLSQFLGPLGLPQGMVSRIAQGAIGRTVMRPAQFALNAAEPDVMGLMGDAALDPKIAAGLLGLKPGSSAFKALWRRQGLLAPPADLLSRRLLSDPSQQ